MTNSEKRADFFIKVCKTVLELKEKGITVMPYSFYRSPEEQEKLYRMGKSKTLKSLHCQWLAIDFAVIKNGTIDWKDTEAYKIMGEIAEKNGLRWGGRFKGFLDLNHIEYPL